MKIENAIASATLKMIVMTKPGALVTCFAAGQNDALYLLGFEQKFDGAVNGGDTQLRQGFLRQAMNLRYG